MVDQDLSRRKILAGMAVAGSSGALVGSGTVSLFSDEETFTNNNLTGSTLVSGAVEIDVTAQVTEDGNGDDNGIEFEISLPESDTYENNPAYIWVRTLSCPVPTSAASQIDVDVSLKEDDTTLDSGSVFEVFATEDDDDFDLNTGELLVPADGNACLEPGDTRTLVVEVTDGPDDASAKIELEVYAEQCRYTSVGGPPENPWADAEDLIRESDCCVKCKSGDELLEKWEFKEFDDGGCKFELERDKGEDPYIIEVVDYENKNSEGCEPKKVIFATAYCDDQTLWAEVKTGDGTFFQKLPVTEGTVTVENEKGDDGKAISWIKFYCEDPRES